MISCDSRWMLTDLAKSIQKNSSLVDSIPQHSATVVDGMVLVQRAKVTQQITFEEVAELIFKMAIIEAKYKSGYCV